MCRMCRRLVHFRGDCVWNRGANAAFLPSPHENILLCPDCAWDWVLLVQACPRRPCITQPCDDLARHIRSIQALTQPGAGDSVASEQGPVKWAKVRRWLLQAVRDRPRPRDEVLEECQTAFPVDVEFLSSVFAQVLQAVCREGLLAVTSRAGVLFLGPA